MPVARIRLFCDAKKKAWFWGTNSTKQTYSYLPTARNVEPRIKLWYICLHKSSNWHLHTSSNSVAVYSSIQTVFQRKPLVFTESSKSLNNSVHMFKHKQTLDCEVEEPWTKCSIGTCWTVLRLRIQSSTNPLGWSSVTGEKSRPTSVNIFEFIRQYSLSLSLFLHRCRTANDTLHVYYIT